MPSYADFAARNFQKLNHSAPGCGVIGYTPKGAPISIAFVENSTSELSRHCVHGALLDSVILAKVVQRQGNITPDL